MLRQDAVSLDNPAYAALASAHSPFAQTSGRARRYPPDVAPFLALPDFPSDADWKHAAGLVEPGSASAVIHDGSALPASWQQIHNFEVLQMIGEHADGTDDPEAVVLGAGDVPEMLELVRLTNPGPFLERTIELGRYLGIRGSGELVAMAGERLHIDGWTEISAVCTAPTRRGLGLASRLISALVAGIEGRSERAFLHVLTDNANAIRLYEELGFRGRRNLDITVVMPGAVSAAAETNA